MDTQSKYTKSVDTTANKRFGRYTNVGWGLTLVGSALWLYGYFMGGSFAVFNWPAISPEWVAPYLPNWQAELGLLLSLLGSIPIYYVQIQTLRHVK